MRNTCAHHASRLFQRRNMNLTKNAGTASHWARPPADRRKRKLSCNTCHRTFRDKKANYFHEPCPAMNNNTAEGLTKRKQQPKVDSSATAAAIRQRDERISSTAADKIATYRAILKKPNTDGTYNVNGKVMSMLDIKRQIRNLESLLVE